MTSTTKLNIVIVDDEELNLVILSKIVNDNGYNAIKFNGGIPAWEYLQDNSNAVDMVILDKMMNDMDGLEVMKNMKNHSILKDIPIIIQTGDINHGQRNVGLALGADKYLIKPYGINEMLISIQEIIQQKHINHVKEVA